MTERKARVQLPAAGLDERGRARLSYQQAKALVAKASGGATLHAGTRIAEIAALDVADVRLSARKGELHLVGKGEKARTVPVHPKLREALTSLAILVSALTAAPAARPS